MSGKQPVLPAAAENELHELISTRSSRGFPFSRKVIQCLTFQYAEHCGLRGFNSERGSAGYYWMRGFLQRHVDLSCKKPESLSSARAAGCSKTVTDSWFEKYEQTLEELQIKDIPSHIWNVDESGLQDYYVSPLVLRETLVTKSILERKVKLQQCWQHLMQLLIMFIGMVRRGPCGFCREGFGKWLDNK